MIFNKHSNLAGMHAFLSPSNPAWTNYDEDKLDRVFMTAKAAERGTDLHDVACRLIRLGVKLDDRVQQTLNMYVNDAIGFRMTPEQTLFYSENCYGTADAISFRRNVLRISDLKTGTNESSPLQLKVYAALFCLEYRVNPFEIEMELRIYQNDELREYLADPDEIIHLREKIIQFNKRIMYLKEEVE